MQQLKQLLAFFKVSEDKYITNSPINLDEKYVFNELLPAFHAYYQGLKEDNSPLINTYRIKSKPILESSAIETLEEYLKKAKKVLLSDSTAKASEGESIIKSILQELSAEVKDLNEFPILYKSIIESASRIRHLQQIIQEEKIEKLEAPLKTISEGIASFTRYNRFKSVLAINAFMKECLATEANVV